MEFIGVVLIELIYVRRGYRLLCGLDPLLWTYLRHWSNVEKTYPRLLGDRKDDKKAIFY